MDESIYNLNITIFKTMNPSDSFKWSQIILLFIFMVLSYCREFETTFTFRQLRQQNSWLFIDKIALSQGTTQIKIETIRQAGQPFGTSGQIYVDLVLENEWEMQERYKCQNRIKMPMILHKLMLDGSSSVSEMNVVVQKPQVYYFVLKDCNKRFVSEYSNQKMFISLKITTINNGSHLGEEEDDHWMIIPVVIFVGVWLIFSDKQFLKDTHQIDPDYAKLVLFGGIATNISSLFWKSVGFAVYSYFGVDHLIFHLVYLFMHALSQTIIIGLLILVGFGWSINFSGKQNLDLIMPAFCLIVSINIVTSLLTQLSSSAHDMHHTFDAVAGTVLIIERICLSLLFLGAICYTYANSRHQVKNFLIKFGSLGFLYICAMPVIIYLANSLIPRKDRNEFVFVGVQITKSVCNILLRYMVVSNQSHYNKVNYKNASFLPSETGMF